MRKLKLAELNRVSVDTFKAQEKTPIIIVLDNIRSALNVGSAFRTSDAFALEHIYLCGITAKPPHREILKTAIGASESMDWTYAEDSTALVKKLKEDGYKTYAVEQAEASISLQNFQLESRHKTALIFGNEVKGVAQEIMDIVDGAIEVPQYGVKHSLNISVCVGVVVWELFRQYRYNQ